MNRELRIGSRVISDENPCYVIAEVGHNHQGSLETCKDLFRAAKECGCDAVKLQKRDNRNMYTKEMYDSPYVNRNSYGDTYGQHREFLEFDRDQFVSLKNFCAELNIDFFGTAFDVKSADFLHELDVPAFKVASGDLTNTPLLTHIAKFGKPMIISTGGAEMTDVWRAYKAVTAINTQLCILQCTSGYPATFDELNLAVIEGYRDAFPNTVVGYSGHDNGIAAPIAAYVKGARVVEKHFTLDRTWKGTDQAFSLAPTGMRKMVRDLKRIHVAIGKRDKEPIPSEKPALTKMQKSIVAARALSAGTALGMDDLAFKSPGGGLPPYRVSELLGRTVAHDLKEDHPLQLGDLI